MYYDIKCPYCGKGLEINHDDGYGYDEDKVFEQECPYCDKIIGYSTMISYTYDVFELPCKNGEDHNLVDIHGYPKEFFVGLKRCSYCNEEFVVDKEASDQARKEYFERLKSKQIDLQ